MEGRAKEVDVQDPSEPEVWGPVAEGLRWARWQAQGVFGYSYAGRRVEVFQVVGGE